MNSWKPKMRKSKPGIAALPAYIKAADTAKAVVTELLRIGATSPCHANRCTEAILEIVMAANARHEEYWKSVDATANASNSNAASKELSAKMQDKLFAWLDTAILTHKGNLDSLADKAMRSEKVPRSRSWIRKQVTEWKKLKRK